MYQPEYEELPPLEEHHDSKAKAVAKRMGLGAFSISLIVHGIFVILAIFFFVRWVDPPEEKVDFLPGGGGGGGDEGTSEHKVEKRKKMMSSTAVAKRLSSTSTTATFSLPDTSNELMDPGLPMDMGVAQIGSGGGEGGGHGTGKGKGIGSGTGDGKGMGAGQQGIGALIPTIMKGRCTDSERAIMLREAGGSDQVEVAVKKSLQWLKGKQNSNGSWGTSNSVAMTGLVLLCYLGHCEGTQSPDYGENVSKGIAFLLDAAMNSDGKIATNFGGNSWVYEHAIATYALSEAHTFSKNLQFKIPNLEITVQKAAELIIAGQTEGGGWDYGYKDGDRNDLSVAGWQLQALKAAKASGVHLSDLDKAIRKAVNWLQDTAYLDDGKFAYTGNTAHPGMTAVGTLCLQQWDKASSKEARGGIKLIMDGLETRKGGEAKGDSAAFAPLYSMKYAGPNCDLYAWYYAVQVMRNAGGKEWDAMNKAILEDIVTAQNDDGSFKNENSQFARNDALVHVRGTESAGPSRDIYLQTLNTLILEVYYRFLPATSAGSRRSSGGLNLDGLR